MIARDEMGVKNLTNMGQNDKLRKDKKQGSLC